MKSVAGLAVCITLLAAHVWAQPEPADDGPPPNAAELLPAYAGAEYFWQQTDVARQIVSRGDDSVIAAIEPYLEEQERTRRANAAFVLAGLGDERGIAVLIAELKDRSPARLVVEVSAARQTIQDRYFAALLLGELRARAAVPALIEATRDSTIAYRAATSLGEIGDPAATGALREMLTTFPEQRVWAGYALAALREPEGFDVLEDVALTDSVWTNRRFAVDLLGKTAHARAVPILLRALGDEHANVRVSTVHALGALGDPAALPALQGALDDDEVTQVNAPTSVAAEAEKAIAAIRARAP